MRRNHVEERAAQRHILHDAAIRVVEIQASFREHRSEKRGIRTISRCKLRVAANENGGIERGNHELAGSITMPSILAVLLIGSNPVLTFSAFFAFDSASWSERASNTARVFRGPNPA